MIKKIVQLLIELLFYLLRIFPIKQNRIVLSNFNGKGYGDNLKPIAEEFKGKDYELIWLIKKKYADIPAYIRQVKWISLLGIYYLVTSKIWINNERFNSFVKKRKKQVYIQTWHSSLRLKKIEMDAIDSLPQSYIKTIQK